MATLKGLAKLLDFPLSHMLPTYWRKLLACVLTPLAAKDAEGSRWVHDGLTMEPPDALRAFRRSCYKCFHRRRDALFELADAILTADGTAPSPAHLSLKASHRRGWGSLYAALDRGRIDDEALRKLLARHPLASTEGETPIYAVDASVWDRCDAGYDPVKVQRGLEGSPCQIRVRLRAGRRFYGDPSLSDPPEHVGRPRRHGPKMKCSDPSTWPEPSAEHHCEDAGYGSVRVRAWAGMHPKVHNHAGKGTRGPLPIVVGTLILVEIERLPRGERRRKPRVLWLWWHGPEGTRPDLDLIWRSYVRCFDLEHTFRFLKQSMGWTTPRIRHPEQADRWTWLVVAAYTQLRLARERVADLRLPWERRYEAGRLTPVRVHRVISSLLMELGTPASAPKPCGRSPGRAKGRLSGRAKRYPAIKKAA